LKWKEIERPGALALHQFSTISCLTKIPAAVGSYFSIMEEKIRAIK
jgi:hypothetical protein